MKRIKFQNICLLLIVICISSCQFTPTRQRVSEKVILDNLISNISKYNGVCSASLEGDDIIVYMKMDSNVAYCPELLGFDRYKLLTKCFSDSSIINTIKSKNIKLTVHQILGCGNDEIDFVSPLNNIQLKGVLESIPNPDLFYKKMDYLTKRFDCHEVAQLNYMLRLLKDDKTTFKRGDTLFSVLYYDYYRLPKTSLAAQDYSQLKDMCRSIQRDTNLAIYDSLDINFSELDAIK